MHWAIVWSGPPLVPKKKRNKCLKHYQNWVPNQKWGWNKKYTAKQKKGFIYTAFLHFKLVLTSISFPILDLPLTCPPFTAALPYYAFPSIKSFNSCFPVSLNGTYLISLASPLHSNWPWKNGFAGETSAKRQAHFLVYSVQPNAMNCVFALPILLHWSTLKRGFRL